jgi:hypothetical protein
MFKSAAAGPGGAWVVPATLTIMFATDAATAPDRDGLWAIGTVLVAVGSLAGRAQGFRRR